MASSKPDKKEQNCTLEAFSELPSDARFNQMQPENGENEVCRDTPGNYKIIDSIDDIKKKTLDAAPPLSDVSDYHQKKKENINSNLLNIKTPSSDFGVDAKQKNKENLNIPVQSSGCSNVSTAHVTEPSTLIGSEATNIEELRETLNDYNMFDYSTYINRDILSLVDSHSQARPYNIRTTSSEEDNRSRIIEKTIPKSFENECGACADTGGDCSPPSSCGAGSTIPSDDTLLTDLSLKIIEMLQYKLETNIGTSWRDLADLHGWKYSEIKDFENHCRASNKSPFQSLLYEHSFQLYTLHELKNDLQKMPRKDILNALDKKLQEIYH